MPEACSSMTGGPARHAEGMPAKLFRPAIRSATRRFFLTLASRKRQQIKRRDAGAVLDNRGAV